MRNTRAPQSRSSEPAKQALGSLSGRAIMKFKLYIQGCRFLWTAGRSSPFPNTARPCFAIETVEGLCRRSFHPGAAHCNGMTWVCCALRHFLTSPQLDFFNYQDSSSKDALCLFISTPQLKLQKGFILRCSLPDGTTPGWRIYGCQRLLPL